MAAGASFAGSAHSLISFVLNTMTRFSSSFWNISSSSGFFCFFREALFRSLCMHPEQILTSPPFSGFSSSSLDDWEPVEDVGLGLDEGPTSSPLALAKARSRFLMSCMALVQTSEV